MTKYEEMHGILEKFESELRANGKKLDWNVVHDAKHFLDNCDNPEYMNKLRAIAVKCIHCGEPTSRYLCLSCENNLTGIEMRQAFDSIGLYGSIVDLLNAFPRFE